MADLLDLIRAPFGVTILATLGALLVSYLWLFAGCAREQYGRFRSPVTREGAP